MGYITLADENERLDKENKELELKYQNTQAMFLEVEARNKELKERLDNIYEERDTVLVEIIELKEKLDKAIECIEFYADHRTSFEVWTCDGEYFVDGGELARKTLEDIKESR